MNYKVKIIVFLLISLNINAKSINIKNLNFKSFINIDSTHLFCVYSNNKNTYDYLFELKNEELINININKIKLFDVKHRNTIALTSNDIYVMCKENYILRKSLNNKYILRIKLPQFWQFNSFGFVQYQDTLFFLADSLNRKKLFKIINNNLIDCNIKEIRSSKFNQFKLINKELIFISDIDSFKFELIKYNLIDNKIRVNFYFKDELIVYDNYENKQVISEEKNYYTFKNDYFFLFNNKKIFLYFKNNDISFQYSSYLNIPSSFNYYKLNFPYNLNIIQLIEHKNKVVFLQENDTNFFINQFNGKSFETVYKIEKIKLNIKSDPILFNSRFYYWNNDKRKILFLQF